MPPKEQIQEIDIQDLSHDGRGVGRLPNDSTKSSGNMGANNNAKKSGKACFVSGALPGERVQWKRSKSRKSFDEGNLVAVITSSEDRVEPSCEFYEACGGCQLQHLKSSAQLAWKECQLQKAVDRAGLNPENWLPPLSRETWNYRRRARLAIIYTAGSKLGKGVQIGFRSKGTHDLVAIDKCVVLDERLNQIIPELVELADQLKNYGLSQIELSAADDQLAICCYVKKSFSSNDLDCFSRLNAKAQIWFRLPRQEAVPVSLERLPLTTKLTDNTWMDFSPAQFVQVNGNMNRAMIAQALEISKPGKYTRVLDLFCGAGNFSLAFAEHVEHVQGVEGSETLCHQASRNAQNMAYSNLDFQTMDLEKPEYFRGIKAKNVDMVILDPPRAGAAKLTSWLNGLGAEKILYVSCHPATMVRDLENLSEKYKIQSMGVMDMFPHTAHLEAMALLIKS